MYTAVLAGLVAVPFLLFLWRKSNSAIAFLGLCLGAMLAVYVAPDFTDVVTAITRGGNAETLRWMQAGILAFSFVYAIFVAGKVRGGKQLINLANGLVASALFVLLLVPYLPVDLQTELHKLVAWKQLDNLQTALFIAAALMS